MATKSVRAEAARRRMVGPSRTRPVGRGRDQQLLGGERGNDALHGRARKFDPLRDLAEAQARRLLLERAQDRRGAGDHLHLALFLHLGLLFGWSKRRSAPAGRNLPAGSPIDTLQPEYGTEIIQSVRGTTRRSGMVAKIALEEHFLCPGFEHYWAPTVVDLPAPKRDQFFSRLTDFGELRLGAMDRAGIARCGALDRRAGRAGRARHRGTACRNARAGNDFLAREIGKRPDRYSGFAHLPMQDASAAADELERAMRDLRFCGAMINGHTNGQYLDHPALDPFWERAQALGALIYLHPADPVTPAPVLEGHKGLRRATWEWTFETGSHALRIIFGGVFDRFPRARLALGHLGETLPFLLWRFDSRAGPGFYAVKLAKLPSQYVKDNIVVATSGMCSPDPLTCTIERARPRPRDVRGRLSVRIHGRGRPFHRRGRARPGGAKRYLLQQCRPAAEAAGRIAPP